MKDLRFIQQNTEQPVPEDLTEAVKDFHKKGASFNSKHEKARTIKQEYEKLKQKKDNSWKEFKHTFLLLSRCRCPICETPINKNDDIDHFRPKNYYWWLAYDYSNYNIYCDLCNRTYKSSSFPLFDNFQVNFKNKNEIEKEKPLLFNPITDNPCDLFELEFKKYNSKGTRLKIKPLSSQAKSSYEYKRAKTTIDTYNLNAEIKDKNPSDTITRKRNAENLFADLYDLAIFWTRFKSNPKDEINEKKLFNKLKILRKEKYIDLEKIILKNNK